jgi:uncharacterized protein
MRFEWDEAKRQWVLEDRGIDLLDMQRLFDGRPVLSYASPQHDENRWTTVGLVQNRLFAVIWTFRGETIRLITARRAWHGEERKYRQLYG